VRAAALVALGCALGGCTAIDPFSFKFADGGAGDLRGSDGGGVVDMTPPGPGAFGEACVVSDGGCVQYAAIGTRPTSCLSQFGPTAIPDNMCSRTCDETILTSCNDYAAVGHGALCIASPSSGSGSGTAICLQRCAPTLGFTCRPGFGCCNNMGKTMGEGVCVPGC
jgi:hypothetical protein